MFRGEGQPAMAVTHAPYPATIVSDQETASLIQLLSRSLRDPGDWRFWIGALFSVGLFVRLFWDNLVHFYYVWTTDENYSHGFLVPLISLYFANQVARRGPVSIVGGQWCGAVLLVAALLVRLVTISLPIPFL